MTGKTIGEMNSEERADFIQEIKDRATPEQWESLCAFASILSDVQTAWNSPENVAARSAAKETIEALKEYLPAIIEELEATPELKDLSLDQIAERPDELQTILDRAAARVNKPARITPEGLSQLISSLPSKHVIPNNKLANALTADEIIDTGAVSLIVSGRNEPKIQTRCILSYEGENVKLTSRQAFTEYDRNVADAITSLYEYGEENHLVTPAMVYRAIVNMTDTEAPSPQQVGAVTRSLDKMRFVRVQIDCTEELTRRKANINGEQIQSGKIDTYLLPLSVIEVMAGGKVTRAYKIERKPILYEYAQITNQVITTPATLLDVREITDGGKLGARISNTEQRIAIKGYLLRRVAVIANKKARTSPRILFSAIYKAAGITEPTKTEQGRIRDYVFAVLKYWTAGEHYIKGFEPIKEGRRIVAVEIST